MCVCVSLSVFAMGWSLFCFRRTGVSPPLDTDYIYEILRSSVRSVGGELGQEAKMVAVSFDCFARNLSFVEAFLDDRCYSLLLGIGGGGGGSSSSEDE